MKKIVGVIMIIAGIFFTSLAIKAIFSAPHTNEQMKSAVTVEDGKVLPENEGKTVVVSGTLKADEPLVDTVTGVKLPGVTAARTVWTYERSQNQNDENVWDWSPQGTNYSESANYGINADFLTSTILAAPTSLGEFKVESRLLIPLIRNTEFKDYDKESLKKGWKLFAKSRKNSECISQESYLPEKTSGGYTARGEGTQKVTYGIVSPDDPLEYTIIGIQKGDSLIKAEHIDTVTTFKGIMTAEEFADKSSKEARSGSIFGIFAGILLAAVGAVLIIFGRP